MAYNAPNLDMDGNEVVLLDGEYICTGCRYVLTMEWFGYRFGKFAGSRFNTCINCRNRGRRTAARSKVCTEFVIQTLRDSLIDTIRTNAILQGVSIPQLTTLGPGSPYPKPLSTQGSLSSTSTNVGKRIPRVFSPEEKQEPRNRPATRSTTVTPRASKSTSSTFDVTEKQHIHIAETIQRPSLNDDNSDRMVRPLDTNEDTQTPKSDNDTKILPATAAMPLGSVSSGLDIIFSPHVNFTSADPSVIFFKSAYPPSLEIFLVMLQIRYEMLLEKNITGIYVESDGERLRVLRSAENGSGMWEVVMNNTFQSVATIKVDVEARHPCNTYSTFITKADV